MLAAQFTANSKSGRTLGLILALVLLHGANAVAEQKFTAIQLWSGFDVAKSNGRIVARVNQYRLGMAAPISPDGYCLTAAHVVESEPVATLHRQSSPDVPLSFQRTARDGMVHYFHGPANRAQAAKTGELKLNGVRVVYRFRKADLAVVKVDFATPDYFRAAACPGPNASFVVRANSCDRNPSSWWMTTDHPHRLAKNDASGRFWTGEIAIPATEGDSGSPAFSPAGILHGILIEKYVPPVWWPFANRQKTIVRFQGASSSMLNRIMNADRARQSGKAAGGRISARPF